MLILESLLILWLLYIPAANIIHRHRAENYTGWRRIAGYAYLAFFWIVDVSVSIIPCTVLYMQIQPTGGGFRVWWHDKKRLTLTWRMYSILLDRAEAFNSGRTEFSLLEQWRFYLALYMCKYMVEPWDFNHCGLVSLGFVTE